MNTTPALHHTGSCRTLTPIALDTTDKSPSGNRTMFPKQDYSICSLRRRNQFLTFQQLRVSSMEIICSKALANPHRNKGNCTEKWKIIKTLITSIENKNTLQRVASVYCINNIHIDSKYQIL